MTTTSPFPPLFRGICRGTMHGAVALILSTTLFPYFDLAKGLEGLKGGETLTIPDGTYSNQVLVLNASGSPDRPTRLVAQTPGRVFFTGGSTLRILGSHVEISGLTFTNGGIPPGHNHVLDVRGDRVTLADIAITSYNHGGGGTKWVNISGSSNRLAFCAFTGKTTEAPTMQVEISSNRPSGAVVERCYFGPRPPLGKNGGETIRIGYSQQARFFGGVVIRENLFEACDGEIEIISVKSTGNHLLRNTFLRCAGALTLRHGNGNRVEENVFLGMGKKEVGGIRVIGADHVILRNHFEGISRGNGAIALTAAQEHFQENGYWTVTNIRIEGNTLASSTAAAVSFSDMLGVKDGSQKVLPADITFASNAWMGEGPAFTGTRGPSLRFSGERARNPGPTDLIGVQVVSLPLPPMGLKRPLGYRDLAVMSRATTGPRFVARE